MIIVAAKATAKPGKRDAFIKAAQPSIAATRKEEGCLAYALYASTENDNDLLYFEKWTGRDVLAKHLEAPHMQAFAKAKEEQDLQAGDVQVDVFDVAE